MIDPGSIPRIEGDMAELAHHANAIAAAGRGFADTGEQVHATWQGLGAVYVAPEAPDLFAATGPVASMTASMSADLESVAAALHTYAAETATIQDRLETLRVQATEQVAAWGAVQDESTTVTLDARDAEITAAVVAAVADWEAEQRRCANAVRALYDAPRVQVAAPPVAYVNAAVTFDDPVANGMPPTSGYAADPVCTATGHFVEVEVDLSAPPSAGVLAWTRVYGSRHARTGPFGRGWSSWASARLQRVFEGVRFTGPDGRRAVFPSGADGYERVSEIAGSLRDGPDGGWVLDWFAGDTWQFDPEGRPVAVVDARGAGTTHLRWSESRLVEMVAPTGRRLDLEWSDDRITALRGADGRVTTYGYDDAGDLIEASGPGGARRYRVDERGRVLAVVDADGVEEVVNSYDAAGRVVAQVSPFGRRTRFTYRTDRSTVVDDDSGGPRTVYFHDEQGRLIGLVDDHGARMSKSYDRWGNPIAITDRAGAVVRQTFDERGNLLRRIEPDGAVTVQEFDELDRLVRRTDPVGGVVELHYAGRDREPSLVVDPMGGRTRLDVVAGQVVGIVDPDGVETRFVRDRGGRVVSVTDGAGGRTLFDYDDAGDLIRTTAPGGVVTEWERDTAGRIATRRDGVGAITRYEWSGAGRALAVVNPVGGTTRREFGPHGMPVAVTDPAGGTSRLEWNALGRLVRLVDPGGAKVEHRHDGLGRLVAVDDPAGGTSLREYDAEGRLTAVVDAAGRRRERELDVRGRVVAESDGVGTVRHTYDLAGRRVRTVDAEGGSLTVGYDVGGRPIAATDAEGAVTRYEWTPGGRLRRRISPLGYVTAWEYDAAGRAVVEIGPDGGRREVDRDGAGRVVTTRTPGGLRTDVRYDPAGRVVARRDPDGATTGVTYDPAGRVTAVTAPDGAVTAYEWTSGGRLTAAVDPLGGTTHFTYDPAGRLIESIDPLGGRQHHTYDEVGRFTGYTDQRGATTSVELDPSGLVSARTDATGATVRMSYDAAGRVRECQGVRVHRDACGRPVRYVESSGRVTEQRYDRVGRPIRWACADEALAWVWDADGRRTAITHSDGSVTRYRHDRVGRLVALEHPAAGGFTIERGPDGSPICISGPGQELYQTWQRGRQRLRDRAGRIVAEQTDAGQRRYAYDRAGRLTGCTEPDGTTTTWTYDAAGRRVSEHSPAGVRRFGYDAAHRLVRIDGPGGTTHLTWDDAGRRTGEQHPDGAVVGYRWDPLGRLAAVTGRDGTTVELDVDASGLLRGVRSPTGSVPVVWDTVGGVPQVRQLGDAQIIGAGEPLARATPDGVCTPLPVDVDRDPWGAPARPGSEPAFGYRGELEIAGLTWLRHRVYDPVTAGFLSPDPLPPLLGSAAANPYSYAGDDPVGAVDPLGLQPLTDAEYQQMRDAEDRPWWEDAIGWVGDHGDEIAVGALAVGAAALIVTGVGAPIGAGILIGMGLSAGVQAVTTGEVDARQLWISGLAGGLSGGLGAGAGALTAGGSTAVRVSAQAGAGAVADSGISVGTQYLATGQVDPGRVLLDGTIGAVAGGAGPALGDLGHAAVDRLRGGASAAPTAPLVHTASDDVRVGRWMGSGEHEAMTRTEMVQAGSGGATTYVAHPASAEAFMRQAKPGTRYVEFDVPRSSLRPAGKEDWAQIPGPDSIYSRRAVRNGEPPLQFPPASNIEWIASRI